MRTKLRLVLVLASLGAIAALAMSGPASAGALADPQTTNVPYVAWVGEKVRLVKCVPTDQHALGGLGDFNTVDWSGFATIQPSYFPSNSQSRPGFAGAGEQAGSDVLRHHRRFGEAGAGEDQAGDAGVCE